MNFQIALCVCKQILGWIMYMRAVSVIKKPTSELGPNCPLRHPCLCSFLSFSKGKKSFGRKGLSLSFCLPSTLCLLLRALQLVPEEKKRDNTNRKQTAKQTDCWQWWWLWLSVSEAIVTHHHQVCSLIASEWRRLLQFLPNYEKRSNAIRGN